MAFFSDADWRVPMYGIMIKLALILLSLINILLFKPFDNRYNENGFYMMIPSVMSWLINAGHMYSFVKINSYDQLGIEIREGQNVYCIEYNIWLIILIFLWLPSNVWFSYIVFTRVERMSASDPYYPSFSIISGSSVVITWVCFLLDLTLTYPTVNIRRWGRSFISPNTHRNRTGTQPEAAAEAPDSIEMVALPRSNEHDVQQEIEHQQDQRGRPPNGVAVNADHLDEQSV